MLGYFISKQNSRDITKKWNIRQEQELVCSILYICTIVNKLKYEKRYYEQKNKNDKKYENLWQKRTQFSFAQHWQATKKLQISPKVRREL